ncbi:hypothetical protein [Streptomyces sp. NPDC001070]
MELTGAGSDAGVHGGRVPYHHRHGGAAREEAWLITHPADRGSAVPRVHGAVHAAPRGVRVDLVAPGRTGTGLIRDRTTGPTVALDPGRARGAPTPTAGCRPGSRRTGTTPPRPAGCAAASPQGTQAGTASSVWTRTRRT